MKTDFSDFGQIEAILPPFPLSRPPFLFGSSQSPIPLLDCITRKRAAFVGASKKSVPNPTQPN
jgi:hypothetical protein